MSLRFAIIVLLSILGGCSGSDSSTDASDADAGASIGQALQFQGPAEVSLLPNKTAALAVQLVNLTGGNVAGVEVDFSFTGSAPGASLSPSSALTDSSGVASTTLVVGSTTGSLQLRAQTKSGLTATVKVSVSEALGSQVAVKVSYQGLRKLATYTVTSLPGMSCQAALQSGLAGDVSYTFPITSTSAVSFELGSGLSSAIVGFGRDASGAKLAVGCQQFTAQITADAAAAQQALQLTLDNQPLAFDDSLPVVLQVTLNTAGTRLADAAQGAVSAALLPTLGDPSAVGADYLLDAVVLALTQQGDSAGLTALASQRALGTLAPSLASTLSQANVGPKALGSKVGSLLLDRSADLTLSSTYQAGVLGPISAFGALSTDGTQQLTLGLRPVVSIIASFSSDSAQLRISTLQLALPLGTYGAAVLDALQTESSSSKPTASSSAFDAAAGCSGVFGPWWTKQSLGSVCDLSVAVAACQTAEVTLLTQMKAALRTLDASAASVQLSGTVQAEDRTCAKCSASSTVTDDGQIDDLGPSDLSGSWGGNAVTAAVTVPVKTAFNN